LNKNGKLVLARCQGCFADVGCLSGKGLIHRKQ